MMATGGEVQGQCTGSAVSEDLDQLKCQPCLEDGNLLEAVGMCVDCQEYLCSQCFKFHTLPKVTRSHQLLDREQMLQTEIRMSPKDICTDKCSVHEDEIIKYYCTTHCLLGCTVCITLEHATCKSVQYIPHVVKDLANNEEYRQVEIQLKSALKTFEKVEENVQKNVGELETTCKEALENIKENRRKIEEALDRIEASLVEQVEAIKSKEIKKVSAINDKYKQRHGELQEALAMIEALQMSNLKCSLYTEMMKTKDKLKSMDAQIKEAEVDESYMEFQIKFYPTQVILDLLNNPETFGIVYRCKDTIVSAKHVLDINVKSGTDKSSCWITGIDILPNGRLVLADNSDNKTIKTVNVQSGRVLSELKLPSRPFDVAAISKNKVAVSLPSIQKIAIVTVSDNDLSVDRELTVSGTCRGVDYSNDKLAVSFSDPHKVQVINLQGTVSYTISADKQGQSLFNNPLYLTYGQDDTTMYVSNHGSHNVVCVKSDGTVMATYTDSDLKGPRKPVVDSHSNVYVCASGSHQVHQISKDCKKIQVLLHQADGLVIPNSLCLSEEDEKLYVGMQINDNIKAYTTVRRAQ